MESILNFFTGSGKSSSFFFFTDNKTLVLKTLKLSEKDLMMEHGILENYYYYIKDHEHTYLSKFYGIYTIRIKFMADITCCIMDNLVG